MPDEKLNPSSPKNQNLAATLSAEERKKIAVEVCRWWRMDKDGRRDWETRRNEWYKLWLMHREPKTEPWPNASNVCLPLIAVACNQFHARSYSAMFSAPGVAKCLPVIGNDVKRADKCEKFMDWQILNDIPDYEDDKDKLLLNVPINGTALSKGRWDDKGERPIFEYASAMNVLLPYRTKNLQTARRITHELWLHYDELGARNRIREGYYVDFDKVSETPGDEPEEEMDDTKDKVETEADQTSERPKRALETHGWWAIGGKGDPKPYIFTVDFDSETLLRMTSRQVKDLVLNQWTDYHFLPNPEGYYSFGFGHFLKNLNEMANTAFNQIFDAGRISNQPFGFYGRRAGLKRKEIRLWPGMMQEVEDATQVFFPTMQRVDQVLFQVLGLIQQYCEQFTSTSDYLLGREAKGVKTPTATGTTAIIEQGLMLYSVMIKRLFRSLKKELSLQFTMNSLYLPERKQYRVQGFDGELAFPEIKRAEFEGKMDIVPLADPSYASKLTRRQEAMELYQFAIMNPLVIAQPNVNVVNPEALAAISRNVIETYDKKDLVGMFPEPPDLMSPEAENALFMQGDTHDPQPGEKHSEHFKTHYQFMAGPIFPTLPTEYQESLKMHLRKTQALMYMEAANAAAMGAVPSGAPTGPSPAPAAPEPPVSDAGPSLPAPVAAPAGPSPVPSPVGAPGA